MKVQFVQGVTIDYPMAMLFSDPQVVALYCLGFVEAAAKLGFSVYETRDKHPK
jgi:hypothetical protein